MILKNFFKVTFILLILCLFFYIMLPFMISILLGGILAMALTPVVEFFIKRGLKRGHSIILMSLTLMIVGLIPAVAFFIRGSKIVTEILADANVSQLTTKITTSTYSFIYKFSKVYGVDRELARTKFDSVVGIVGTFVAKTFSGFMAELPTVMMVGFIMILAMYCFLKESEKIRELFDRYFYFTKEKGDRFVSMIQLCCQEVFVSNILTGIIQSTIVSLGALVFGVGDFFLVFFITFIFSFVPIIGAGPVAAVLGLICFFEGRVGPGIGMMVVAGVSGISDNVIRPFLASRGNVEVHPFIGLLSVIGGVIMFELPGLFIGPLVASLFFGALPFIIDEYFPKESAEEENQIIAIERL
jgi:predicted PurR-regulated permease PerM